MTPVRWWLGVDDRAPASQRRAVILRRALAIFALAPVAVTWRLWIPQQVFPQVPFFRAALFVPASLQWTALVGMLAGLTAALVALAQSRWATVALVVFVASMLALTTVDQHRLQPWAYQFVLVALVLAWVEPPAAFRLLRLFVISFYFHSALTKCDYSFLHTLGQQFLAALAGAMGMSLENWSTSAKLVAAAVFPAGELLIAVGLCFAATRRAALAGAVLLHLLLLVILGPWGLNHKPGVLVWNVFFIVQDILLFGSRTPALVRKTLADAPLLAEPPAGAPWPVVAIVWAAALLPFLAPTTWFDLWPSWGLYASSAERTVLFVHRRARDELPRELHRFLEASGEADDPWLTFRLDRWSLETFGAPLYPQNRYQLGVAEALVAHYQISHRARVVRFAMAARSSGQRDHDTLSGLPQVVAAGDDYFLNTRPNQIAFDPPDRDEANPAGPF